MRRLLLACCCAAALCTTVATGAARADVSVLPATTAAPGSDASHQTPVEQLLSAVASTIAGGRPAHVQCYPDAASWAAVQAAHGIPGDVAGFVATSWTTVGGTVTWNGAGPEIYLAPGSCQALAAFAVAASKPTKCATTAPVATTTLVDVPVRRVVGVTRAKRVQVNGRWVVRRVVVPAVVRTTKKVAQTVTTTQPGPALPCYQADGNTWLGDTSSYWTSYWATVDALAVLAHEATHLAQYLPGVPEDQVRPSADAVANCAALQWLPWAAEQLGDTSDDAAALAKAYYRLAYPGFRNVTSDTGEGPEWSADCRAGGALDLHLAGATPW